MVEMFANSMKPLVAARIFRPAASLLHLLKSFRILCHISN